MQTVLIIVATILVSAVIFIPIGVKIRKRIAESKIQSAEKEVENIINLMNNMKWTAVQAMDALGISPAEQKQYMSRL